MTSKTALAYSDLPSDLKKLAKSSLGSGVLRSLFRYRYTYHLMVKAIGDDIVSMVLYHYESEGRDESRLIVGVIDCVCVDPNYRGQGFGTLITFATIRKMSASGATSVESIVKLPAKDDGPRNRKPYSVKLDEFMRSLGFELQGYRDNYYVKNSLKYRYTCAICESLPDECRGAHYTIAPNDDAEGED